jgi:hypothetical protein
VGEGRAQAEVVEVAVAVEVVVEAAVVVEEM